MERERGGRGREVERWRGREADRGGVRWREVEREVERERWRGKEARGREVERWRQEGGRGEVEAGRERGGEVESEGGGEGKVKRERDEEGGEKSHSPITSVNMAAMNNDSQHTFSVYSMMTSLSHVKRIISVPNSFLATLK